MWLINAMADLVEYTTLKQFTIASDLFYEIFEKKIIICKNILYQKYPLLTNYKKVLE